MYSDIKNYRFPCFFDYSDDFLQNTDKLTTEEKKLIVEQIDKHYQNNILPLKIEQAYQQGVEHGYKQGFEKGMSIQHDKILKSQEQEWQEEKYIEYFNKGFVEGKEKAQKTCLEKLLYLDQCIEKLQQQSTETLEEMTDHIFMIIQHLVKKIVFIDIDRREQIEGTIKSCLGLMPSFKETELVEIWIHPDDKALLTDLVGQKNIQNTFKHIILLEKNDIEPGGFILSWKAMLIDAQLSHRFQKVMKAYDCSASTG